MATASVSIIEETISLTFSRGTTSTHTTLTTRATANLSVPPNCVAIDAFFFGSATVNYSSNYQSEIRISDQSGNSLYSTGYVVGGLSQTLTPPAIGVLSKTTTQLNIQTRVNGASTSMGSSITAKIRYYVSNL